MRRSHTDLIPIRVIVPASEKSKTGMFALPAFGVLERLRDQLGPR